VETVNVGSRKARWIALALVALVIVWRSLTVVPAGHVVVLDLFGRVPDEVLHPGLRLKNPLARAVRMSVMTRQVKEEIDTPSAEGLSVRIEASLLWHLDAARAPEVYRTLGVDYFPVLLEPEFRAVTRTVTARHDARALYTSERERVAQRLADELRARVGPRGLVVEGVPLRKLTLPPRLAAAIEEKLSAEQEAQRMEFVLARERQEAERKRLEAQGIADFQRIVSAGISTELLRWKGIEATVKLAESQNAKVVVVGARDGLPLILGSQ
jgi:regulator of protease activity HflC (stomatin/prohibitin superfamily)